MCTVAILIYTHDATYLLSTKVQRIYRSGFYKLVSWVYGATWIMVWVGGWDIYGVGRLFFAFVP